ncbi:uncharacterized protein LOC121400528 [Xenopus laevis]|uniref:Uncharacterized protein LOC121400528 n=1 Tax=Xenopus laevis TaxID=8355 RepID=A0A8J1MDD9_XENLA|nr:uncharacterized protein LOC121400528 [Xenopus laevis]XP_041439726.1 uncharacterized protein LOC121400528 [Xenopus laevis]XP_041439727.1 uncharacterized protein LOC121400528 [Xenopus laevis]
MSFADIAASTDRRADTFSFTETERRKILNATQSLPTSVSKSGIDTARKIEQLKKREVAWAMHMSSLAEYAKAQRIPRGLRIMLQPALFKDNQEFLAKWRAILNRCSLDLITLTVQQLQSGSRELKQQLHVLEDEYKALPDTDTALIRDLEVKLERMQAELLQMKLRKFARDTRDYNRGEVYTWKDTRRQTRKHRSASAVSSDMGSAHSSESGRESPASSQGAAVSFLGKGHPRHTGGPGGASENQQAGLRSSRKKTYRR